MVWVPIAVAVTGLAALVYVAVQQDLRQGANDPQVQLVEDAAARLDAGAGPNAVVPSDMVDIATSLAPYVVVFDAGGAELASSAVLHDGTLPFPRSVFDAVRNRREDVITWQPEPGVRSAVVVEAWRGGFVLAGRSLRLVEDRENKVMLISAGMWLLTLGASAVASLVVSAVFEMRSPQR